MKLFSLFWSDYMKCFRSAKKSACAYVFYCKRCRHWIREDNSVLKNTRFWILDIFVKCRARLKCLSLCKLQTVFWIFAQYRSFLGLMTAIIIVSLGLTANTDEIVGWQTNGMSNWLKYLLQQNEKGYDHYQ